VTSLLPTCYISSCPQPSSAGACCVQRPRIDSRSNVSSRWGRGRLVGVVHRTARVGVRATKAQRRRLYGVLVAAGDVWAALIDMNRERLRRGGPPIVGYAALCRELAGCADLGELDMAGADRCCAAIATAGSSPTAARNAVRRRAIRGVSDGCCRCAGGQSGHRDIVGARNIATNGGGVTRPPGRVEHRRAGVVPARRDRRRHRWDKRRQRRRSRPAPGRPPPPEEWESLAPTARTAELPHVQPIREDASAEEHYISR
jgi:hypothetical protein